MKFIPFILNCECHSHTQYQLAGVVEFAEAGGGTEISLRFEHCIPIVYVNYNIGHIVINRHITDILNENLQVFKKLAEGDIQPQGEKEFTSEEREELLTMCREKLGTLMKDLDKFEEAQEQAKQNSESSVDNDESQ